MYIYTKPLWFSPPKIQFPSSSSTEVWNLEAFPWICDRQCWHSNAGAHDVWVFFCCGCFARKKLVVGGFSKGHGTMGPTLGRIKLDAKVWWFWGISLNSALCGLVIEWPLFNIFYVYSYLGKWSNLDHVSTELKPPTRKPKKKTDIPSERKKTTHVGHG